PRLRAGGWHSAAGHRGDRVHEPDRGSTLHRARSARARRKERVGMSQVPSVPATAASATQQDTQPPPPLAPNRRGLLRSASWGVRLWALARGTWRLVTLNRKMMVGSGIVGFFILVALCGPLVVTHDPLKFTPELLRPPSAQHWLGTNQGGQDVFAQLV